MIMMMITKMTKMMLLMLMLIFILIIKGGENGLAVGDDSCVVKMMVMTQMKVW